jgi:hypothetical protein
VTAADPAARADRLLDEVLATPAPVPAGCECGDPHCIFATTTTTEEAT